MNLLFQMFMMQNYGLHCINGDPYLLLPNNLCLALNFDLFNPYKQTPYSAGAIYLCILNFPRYKHHNMILVGMIPGPCEPTNLNSFLLSLVEDFKRLYQGIYITNNSKKVKVRAVLSCVVCDLPATRKVCGFSNSKDVPNALKISQLKASDPSQTIQGMILNIGLNEKHW